MNTLYIIEDLVCITLYNLARIYSLKQLRLFNSFCEHPTLLSNMAAKQKQYTVGS